MGLLKLAVLWLLANVADVLGCTCDTSFGCYINWIFDNCCRRISLDYTEQRVALTAFFPNGYPDGLGLPTRYFSKLYLDEISLFDGRNLVLLDINTGAHVNESANLTAACTSRSFVLSNSTLKGTCGNNITVVQDLMGRIRSLDGLLQTYITSRHNNGSFRGDIDQTCNNINFDGRTLWLQANCSTNPYELPEKRGDWMPSSLYLPDCLSRDPALGNVSQTDVRADIINRTKNCSLSASASEPATVLFTCPDNSWNKTIFLPDFTWNHDGTLMCYDVVGKNLSAQHSLFRTNVTIRRVHRVRNKAATALPVLQISGRGLWFDFSRQLEVGEGQLLWKMGTQ